MLTHNHTHAPTPTHPRTYSYTPTPTRNHVHAPTSAHPRLHLSMPTLTHNLTHVPTAAHLRPIFTGRFAPSFPTCPLFSTKLRPNRSAPTPPRKRTFALLSPVEPPLSSTELPSPSPTFPFSQRNCAPLSAHLCLSSYASLSSVRCTALVGCTCLRNPFYVEVQP